MGKDSKKPTAKGLPIHGVWGVLLLTVAASVLYANYRVFFGTGNVVSRVMLIPSTAAVIAFLVYKATK